MNDNELKHLKNTLLDMQKNLESLEKTLKNSTATVVLDQNSVGRLSRMDAMQAQQMALESERRRQAQLVQVDLALKRIDNDDYGYCRICDNEIIFGRLQIDPTVTQCVKCCDK